MRLTVLGRWGAWPPVGGACPGYLVEAAGTRLLLDCGTGVLERLQRVVDPHDLAGVVVTHLHPDHVLDLYPLRLYLALAPRRSGAPPALPMPLVAPPDAPDVLAALLGRDASPVAFAAFDGRAVFDHRPIEAGAPRRLGDVTLRFAPVRHAIRSWAVRIEAEGVSLVYSADTTASDDLEALARGADLLVCESTLLERELDLAERTGHMTARMAGEAAARAGARRLLLTHFFPTNRPEDSLADAAKAYGGPVELAEEGRTYAVRPPGGPA